MTTKPPKFLKIYEDLITGEQYQNDKLTLNEIVLYSKLLALGNLSIKNDKTAIYNKSYHLPYVYFSLKQTEELLRCSRMTAIRTLEKLESKKLIMTEKRQGKASEIYVFNLRNGQGEFIDWLTFDNYEDDN